MINKITYLLVISIFLMGCSKDPATLEEYQGWFNDPENNFTKEKNIKPLTFSVQYRPAELMALNEIKALNAPKAEDVKKLTGEYTDSHYFLFRIRYNPGQVKEGEGNLQFLGARSFEEYAQKLEQLSFELKSQVRLITSGDTLAPSISHYEPTYELGYTQHILLAFPKEKDFDKEQMTFIYDDRVFNTGIQKYQFTIRKENIPEIPL